jgi:hypothetical protein
VNSYICHARRIGDRPIHLRSHDQAQAAPRISRSAPCVGFSAQVVGAKFLAYAEAFRWQAMK